MTRLAGVLSQAAPRLQQIGEELASRRPGEGKWSKKEILGHLIDSASNNHQRWVRAQLAPSIEFPAYEQDGWVRVQAYQAESWASLVELWLGLNRHLVHFIETMPAESLEHRCSIGGRAPIPLGSLIDDYAGHLEHHLAQIFS